MRNHDFIKSFQADGAITANRIVKLVNELEVAQASAASDAMVGVADLGAADNATVSIVLGGIAQVTYGGTVTAGAWLTADSSGRAIATTTAGNVVIGKAMAAGVIGDLGSVLLAPSRYAAAGA